MAGRGDLFILGEPSGFRIGFRSGPVAGRLHEGRFDRRVRLDEGRQVGVMNIAEREARLCLILSSKLRRTGQAYLAFSEIGVELKLEILAGAGRCELSLA